MGKNSWGEWVSLAGRRDLLERSCQLFWAGCGKWSVLFPNDQRADLGPAQGIIGKQLSAPHSDDISIIENIQQCSGLSREALSSLPLACSSRGQRVTHEGQITKRTLWLLRSLPSLSNYNSSWTDRMWTVRERGVTGSSQRMCALWDGKLHTRTMTVVLPLNLLFFF